ncbi:globin domain-containing protein [Streptomyces lydicamycinicus]|uniref:globin domain-containing protein n=1 Tax=Streptomyces lydicamycinicus TaxID=1546107 RepID=UPI003D809A81
MAEIEPVADKVTSYFYALLFVQYPDLRALFPASMDTQRDRLFKALLTAAQHVDDADVLTAYLANLGRGHRKYGTQPDHYPAVGECLLSSLARYATSSWGPETQAAWVRAYTAISQIMIDAAAEDEAVAPAWWQAEVVSHELRTPDIAVVTVRPDQPYPFLAGQYTSVETPGGRASGGTTPSPRHPAPTVCSPSMSRRSRPAGSPTPWSIAPAPATSSGSGLPAAR